MYKLLFYTLALSIFPILLFSKDVVFYSLNVAPNEHFSEFVSKLKAKGIQADVVTCFKYLSKYDKNIQGLSLVEDITHIQDIADLNQSNISPLIDYLQDYKLVIMDCHHSLNQHILRQLSTKRSQTKTALYYDNPETFVPGGYSKTVSTLLTEKVHALLLANKQLETKDLLDGNKDKIQLETKKIGIGFYSLKDVDKILEYRKSLKDLRKKLFENLSLQDTYQQIIVYFGGANTYYYETAFPHFIKILKKLKSHPYLKNTLILLQQHPRAIKEGNYDGKLLNDLDQHLPRNAFQLKISPLSTLEIAALCNLALYSQTSLCGKFHLADIYMAQVGVEPLKDVCLNLNISSCVKTPQDFLFLFEKSSRIDKKAKVLESIGYDKNWEENLLEYILEAKK